MTAAGSGASAQIAVSENLKFLPLLCLGLLKHVSNASKIYALETVIDSCIVIGWAKAECADSTGSEGVCAGVADDATVAAVDGVYPSWVLLVTQHASRGELYIILHSKAFGLTGFILVWHGRRTRNHHASATPADERTSGATRFVPNRGWAKYVPVGWKGGCTPAGDGRIRRTQLRGAAWWQSA